MRDIHYIEHYLNFDTRTKWSDVSWIQLIVGTYLSINSYVYQNTFKWIVDEECLYKLELDCNELEQCFTFDDF